MKIFFANFLKATALSLPFIVSTAFAQTNVWTGTGSDKWENPADWSLAVPPASNQFCFLTNSGTKTVTIDATTSGSFPATMTVSNLTVSSAGGVNTLALTDAGTNNPLRILNAFTLQGANLLITNSAFEIDGTNSSSNSFISDGTTVLNHGVFTATNMTYEYIGYQQPGSFGATNSQVALGGFNAIIKAGLNSSGALNLVNSTTLIQSLYLGDSGVTGSLLIDGGSYTSPFDIYVGDGGTGLMTVTGAASVQLRVLVVGAASPGTGTLTMLGGNLNPIQVFIGENAGSTGVMIVSNGTVNVPNASATFAVGVNGSGTLDIAGGSVMAPFMPIGQHAGSTGSLTVSGGTLNVVPDVFGGVTVADDVSSTGTVSVMSGTLNQTNSPIIVGQGGHGSFNVSGGNVFADGFNLGVNPGATGALTVSGGSVVSDGSIFCGTNGGGSGSVTVLTNGTLTVTNLAGDGTIALASGSALILNGGTLAADMLDFTNGGSFTNSGGSLLYLGPFQLESNAAVAVNNGGSIVAATDFIIGSMSNSSPSVVISDGSSLAVTNGGLYLGNDGGANNSGGGSLSVSNGTVQAAAIFAGSFSTNLNAIIVQGTNGLIDVHAVAAGSISNSAVSITVTNGGRMNVATNMLLAQAPNSIVGVRILDGGTLNVANTLGIGNDGTTNGGSGSASVTISNATGNVGMLTMGSTAGGLGTLTLQSNAVLNLASNLTVVSGSITQTSTVTAGAGSMIYAPNSTIVIGSHGAGQMTVNGGGVIAKLVKLGGTLASGGLHIISGFLKAAGFTTNFILVDGGDLDGSGGTITIGDSHDAAMTVNNGTAEAGTMLVGYTPGFTGTYTQSGGTVNVFTNLIVGDCVGGTLGVATLTGGTLYVTNDTHTAVLDVRNGTFTLNAGATLVVDTLIVTNSCGHFRKNGGTLIQNNPAILDPAQSAANDGIPNGWKQQYGFDPFDTSVATADPDHDGQNNLNEYLSGTNPTNAASVFKLLDAAVTNQNVRVDWTTVGGHSYVVQTNGDLTNGAFNDLSQPISVPGTNEGTTNYLHNGAGTNSAGFYRVRLGP